jgi:hypothetical protein
MWICGGSGFPSRIGARTNAMRRPSGDQRGCESRVPTVRRAGGALPSAGTIQIAVS